MLMMFLDGVDDDDDDADDYADVDTTKFIW